MTLLHWLGEDCHESFASHFSRSDCLLHPSPVVLLFSRSSGCWPWAYLWAGPLRSELRMEAQMTHFSTQSVVFLCRLSFFFNHVLKVSVLLERISASYQWDSLMPTSLLCLPAANYHLDQGGFLNASCGDLEKKNARLKLNWNSTQMSDQRKVTVGFKMSRLYVNTQFIF